MEQELKPFEKNASQNLADASKCIHSAIDILKDAGFHKSAQELSDVLNAITHGPKSTQVMTHLPKINDMLAAGVTLADFEKLNKGDVRAKAKINKVLYQMGFNPRQIAEVLGISNVMPRADAEAFGNPHSSSSAILRMIENPFAVAPGEEVKPGDEIVMESLASKHKKPKDPRKISDPHTKGLTPEKMVKNLLHHGTEFNMADDGRADDLLDLDISDADLEVLENEALSDMDFEDEI